MQPFLTLSSQLLLIVCMQSVLEAVATRRRQNHLQKPIGLGCYFAALVLVLRFMQDYLMDIIHALARGI